MAEGEQTGPGARYGLLLVTLVAAYLVSAVTHSNWAAAVHVAFVVVIALLAVRHSRLGPRATTAAISALLVTAVAAGFGATSANATAEGIAALWNGLLLLMTVVIIIDRVLGLDRVTVQSLYAALSTQDGQLAVDGTAYAMHAAIQNLRARGAHPIQWAPYFHSGP